MLHYRVVCSRAGGREHGHVHFRDHGVPGQEEAFRGSRSRTRRGRPPSGISSRAGPTSWSRKGQPREYQLPRAPISASRKASACAPERRSWSSRSAPSPRSWEQRTKRRDKVPGVLDASIPALAQHGASDITCFESLRIAVPEQKTTGDHLLDADGGGSQATLPSQVIAVANQKSIPGRACHAAPRRRHPATAAETQAAAPDHAPRSRP